MLLDLTGASSDNNRTVPIPIHYKGGELAVLSPQCGFFHTSMSSPVLRHNGEELKYGKDYRYAYRSKEIRDKYKISAHASIMLLRNDLSGQIDMTANFIGGKYRMYLTDYVSHITSTDYLLSLYDVDDLIDLPNYLPPKASILDMEKVNHGMMSSVQLIFNIGLYLKDYEDDYEKPSTGYTWPDVSIEELEPPIDIHLEIGSGGLTPIPEDNLAKSRLGFYPIGHLPIGFDFT